MAELKNEKLLKSVGVDYSSFSNQEIGKIITESLMKSKGVKKPKFNTFANNLENSVDFIKSVVRYFSLSFDELEDVKKEVNNKFDSIKKEELKKVEKQLEELNKKKELLLK